MEDEVPRAKSMARAAEGLLRNWRHDERTIDLAGAAVGYVHVETGFKETNTENGFSFSVSLLSARTHVVVNN